MQTISCNLRGLAWAALLATGLASPAWAGPILTVEPGADAQQRLQTALIEAEPGAVVELAAGRYDFDATLSLDVPGVTLRGQGMDQTVLNFSGLRQGTGGEGLSVTSNRFTLEDLAVVDCHGDAVKISGAQDVTLRRVRVEWTAGPNPTNGSYGLYPVLCKNVLVEDCVVIGASDAGIYVGQSQQIVVRRNRASQNVAGIEIENSLHADVYDNEVTDNAGGILVFTLPDLVQKGGRYCRVFHNRIVANNHVNFAPKGNIVAQVPAGTGIMVMASDDVEIFDNDVKDNRTVNLTIIGYRVTHLKFSDPDYDPYAEGVSVHDNRFSGGGDKPSGDLALLKLLLRRPTLPDIVCDSAEDPAKKRQGQLPAALRNVFENNGDADFARLDLAARIPNPNTISQDIVAFAGRHEALPPVELPPAADVAWQSVPAPPADLADYGLFEGDVAQHRPAAGAIPYDVNSALFSDYTVKHRFIRLPEGKPAVYSADGPFDLPVGTVIAKTFAMPRDLRDPAQGQRLLETRILIRHEAPVGWVGWPYVWNAEQTQAVLQRAGGSVDVEWIHSDGSPRANNYIVPNSNHCKGCHASAAGMRPIGIQARHLNREFAYESGERNQLEYWADRAALAGAPAPADAPRLAAWDDPASGTLDRRARAWLEINCAHCHQPGGAAQNSGLDLLAAQQEPVKFGVRKPPVAAGAGSGGLKFDIVPGKPDQSILFFRAVSTHPDIMMPELGKRLVHAEGVELLREWIAEMDRQSPKIDKE